MPELHNAQLPGRLLISHLIRLAHQSQDKTAAPLSDEPGKQVTRCPLPDHPDKNPSCDFDNSQGRTGHFNCRSCGESGFGDELAQRLFPDTSYLDLLKEAQNLEGSRPVAGPSRNIPPAPMRTQLGPPQVIPGERRRAPAPRPSNHRQALPQGADPEAVDQRRRDLLSVNEAAARWYQAQLASSASFLSKSDPEIHGKTYFRRRGIDDDTHAKFRLGYAPLNTSLDLHRQLHQEKFASSLPLQADIFRSSKSNPDYTYSPFEGRAILPMQNEEGHVIGFGGRLVGTPAASENAGPVAAKPNADGAGETKKAYSPKYMHSANVWLVDNTVALFKKGDWFFNMHRARSGVRDSGRLLVVEGYLDVVGLYQAGIQEVVSPIGVTLSETQLRRAWELVDQPIICLDGDDAGRRAAGRIAARAYAILNPEGAKALAGKVTATLANRPVKVLTDEERATLAGEAAATAGRKSLRFALLDGGKDPFDIVREGMDHTLRTAVMDLRPHSREELSGKMRQGGARAFEAKLRNPITLEVMVVEKLARDVDEAAKRAGRASDAAGSKRKREDEPEPLSPNPREANARDAEAILDSYLSQKNLIRHQIVFPLVSWEAQSPYGPEAGEAAWKKSILNLRRDLKAALMKLHQEERQRLLPLAGRMAKRQIDQIVSATEALHVHDRTQSPEWRMDLPIGLLPPLRLPFSPARDAADRDQQAGHAHNADPGEPPSDAPVTATAKAVSLRARNYALVNHDLCGFETTTHAAFRAALNDAPSSMQSMTAASERLRQNVKTTLEKRLALHRQELPPVDRSAGETSTVGRTSLVTNPELDCRTREEHRV